MSCPANCDTVQIIEPKHDLIVGVGSANNDVDEQGEIALVQGQRNVIVVFQVPKINAGYNFEYLYVDCEGIVHPGTVHPIPTVRAAEGFACVLAGSPLTSGYVLHWRVVVKDAPIIVQIDAPEDLYIQLPQGQNNLTITFVNPRSDTNYGFSELRVENLHDLHQNQAVIRVQVYQKTLSGFSIAINPRPPSIFYFLRVRTP